MIDGGWLFGAFAFVLGACIGSFLNVVIYRLPRDLSVNEPRRSFCPACKQQIPWYRNLPLVSWLMLRGRCANCGARIAFRYFAVELLTASLFLVIWGAFPPFVAVAYWVFIALVIAGTFIDFEHFIIPDEITLGGTVAGLIAAWLVPQLMGVNERGRALLLSAVGAVTGYVLLWLVLEGGKLVFGKKRIRLEKPTPFLWKRQGDDADLMVGEEKGRWSDYFSRETDRLFLYCREAQIAQKTFLNPTLRFHYDRLEVEQDKFQLDQLDEIRGVVSEIQIPREAMGRGDLKFVACIGAFLGWKAVFFSLFAGSLYGSLIGLATLIFGRRVWSLRLPFGPYLALGAVTWMFWGETFLRWYGSLLTPT